MSKQPAKRIAHLLPFPSIGGTELATLRIAEATRGAALEHVAFHLEPARAVAQLFAQAGFAAHPWQAVEPSVRQPWAYLRNMRRLTAQLKAERIDLLHCADYLAAFYGSLAGRMAGIPVLCHIRNRSGAISGRDRLFLRPVQRYVFVSQASWNQFGIVVPPAKGEVVYDGIDIAPDDAAAQAATRAEVCREFDLPPQATLAVMVARVAPQKDYETLIDAAARIAPAYPDVRFVIVGDHASNEVNRETYKKISALIAARGLARFFHFTGFRRDVDRFLQACDLFVLSTHFEGLPLVLLEAMAYAKPVVATDVDGIPEIVHHAQNGLLHGHEDAAGLAENLRTLLIDPELRARYGKAGRALVEREFTRPAFGRNMTALYRRMLDLA